LVELDRPPQKRREAGLALAVVLVAGLATTLLGIRHIGDHNPGRFDAFVAHAVDTTLGGHTGVMTALVVSTQPYVLIPAIALIAGICAYRRRFGAAALAVLGPAIAVAVNTWLLKPLFDRYNDGYLAYPSGHTVSLVSVLTVLVVLTGRRARTAAVVAIGAVLLLCAAAGMIGLGYHYATDIIGGTFFAVTAVLLVHLLLTTPEWRGRF
jgi:membrane-associated phospholipid phosphatase